jgi:hypothetical protein
LSLAVLEEFEDNPLAFWKHHEKSFPNLSNIAEVYSGMIASSVPVECTFSTTGLIANGKRSAIGPEKLNRVLFVYDYFVFVVTLC